jgi:aldehyde:ferredoxin oxidoreductase
MPESERKRKTLKGGYFQKVLYVDLTNGEVVKREYSDEFALKYIGGRGFGAKIVWDNLLKAKKIDPLGPDNVIVIAPGPLSGLYLPASGKCSFVSISPLTGIYGDSSMGGSFGIELRQAGYDALVIKGKAKSSSYLWIDEDDIKIVRSSALKGKSCLETEGLIKKELRDDDVKIASIGIAGENLVRFASLSSDWGRNAGRAGMGAVLGSKNIKAIAVRGAKDLPVYDIKGLRKVGKKAYNFLASHPLFEFWQQQGLMSVVDYLNSAGLLPSYNFRDGVFEGADKINGFEMELKYKIGDKACFACPMTCSNVCLVKEGKYRGTVVEGPEYETACMLGSNIGVDNFACILRGNFLCDELGMDTISCGNLIGVMIEGYESGVLSLDDIDGMALHWGDEDNILTLMEKIARREGVGDILAGGARKVIEKWPKLNPIISQVKGMEQSAYDGRVAISMALAYGTSDIGAHHTRAWTLAKEIEMGLGWELERKVDLVIYHQTIRPLFDMLGVCRLPWIELGIDERFYADFYRATTGIDYSLEDLLQRSNDIYDLTRLINAKLGVSRKDDYPPERVFDVPIRTGPHAGKSLSRDEYEKMLDIYYQKRGWDKNGIPPKGTEKKFSDRL